MKSKIIPIIYAVMFAGLLYIDRATKSLVMRSMEVGDAIPSHDSFFAIRYTLNTGVSFSMLEGHTEALIAMQAILLTVVAAAFFVTYIKLRHPLLQTALCWIAVGGAGNLADRAMFGYVVDFISVGTFPVWNFADMCVVGGCILIAIYILKIYPKEHSGDSSIEHNGDGSFYVHDEIEHNGEHNGDGSFYVHDEVEHNGDGSFYVHGEGGSPAKVSDAETSDE